MKAPLSYVPMLPAAVGIAAGVLIEAYVSAWIIAAICVAAFCVLYLRGRQYWSFFCLFTMVGGFLALTHRPLAPDEKFFSGEHAITATVSDISETANGLSMVTNISAIDGQPVALVTCMVYLRGKDIDIDDGCRVEFPGHLSPLPPPSVVPYSFDYGEYLRINGISYTISTAASKVDIVDGPTPWRRAVNAVRGALYNGIVESPVSGECAAFLVAAILGDRQYIGQSQREEYRLTGVAHMLALSGLHVGILASLLSLLLIPLQMVRRGYVVRALLVIIVVWAYAVIVGMPDSVMRAAVMISVFLLSLIIQRGYYPVNSLCMAFVIVLAVSPLSIYRPGFQMSFAAVASILAVNALVPHAARRWRWYRVASVFMLPVAAMLGTGIVAAYYYHMFPGMFLLANVLVGMVFPIMLSLGYVMMLLTMLGIDLSVIGWVVDTLYNIMSGGIAQLARLRFMAVETYFPGWAVLPYYATLALVITALARRSRLWAIGAACMAVVTALAFYYKPAMPAAEMYLPSEMGNCMILRSGPHTYVWPLDVARTTDIVAECADRYDTFLRQRGCDSLAILDSPSADANFSYRDNVLATRRHIFVAIDDDNCGAFTLTRCSYAIITPSFTGHTTQIVDAVHPDTLLICAGVAPSRASRLIREADTVPVLKLRTAPRSFSLE